MHRWKKLQKSSRPDQTILPGHVGTRSAAMGCGTHHSRTLPPPLRCPHSDGQCLMLLPKDEEQSSLYPPAQHFQHFIQILGSKSSLNLILDNLSISISRTISSRWLSLQTDFFLGSCQPNKPSLLQFEEHYFWEKAVYNLIILFQPLCLMLT